jgi:hypothetical protein
MAMLYLLQLRANGKYTAVTLAVTPNMYQFGANTFRRAKHSTPEVVCGIALFFITQAYRHARTV